MVKIIVPLKSKQHFHDLFMDRDKIKIAKELVDKVEQMENYLQELYKSEQVDYIELRHHQSGSKSGSYEVKIYGHEHEEFMKIMKGAIERYYQIKILKLQKEIESL